MGILTGEYRDCVPSREVLVELTRQIPANKTGQLCKVLGVKQEHPGAHNERDVSELLVRWMEQGKCRKREQRKLSNEVYEAGFIGLANEIMTGIRHGKVTQLTNS
ncbi:uncharacterized protein [Diadema setosum]|uniref:uncharacterized protein n=1 Tax=Diadema setosum TaxID=31175 RepID=UPI003B3B31AF